MSIHNDGPEDEELLAGSLLRLDAMIAEGVTTVEIKSGYGLDQDTELRMLRTARALEDRLGYFVPSGRYWEVEGQFSLSQIDRLDQMWLAAHEACGLGELMGVS